MLENNVDPNELSRIELLALAQKLHVSDADVMTRAELRAAIDKARKPAPTPTAQPTTWVSVARRLLASIVEQGLNLPDAAALIRGDTKLSTPPKAPPPVATVTLARIYAAQGHLPRAIKTLDQVLASDPDHDLARELRQQLSARLEEKRQHEANAAAASEPGSDAAAAASQGASSASTEAEASGADVSSAGTRPALVFPEPAPQPLATAAAFAAEPSSTAVYSEPPTVVEAPVPAKVEAARGVVEALAEPPVVTEVPVAIAEPPFIAEPVVTAAPAVIAEPPFIAEPPAVAEPPFIAEIAAPEPSTLGLGSFGTVEAQQTSSTVAEPPTSAEPPISSEPQPTVAVSPAGPPGQAATTRSPSPPAAPRGPGLVAIESDVAGTYLYWELAAPAQASAEPHWIVMVTYTPEEAGSARRERHFPIYQAEGALRVEGLPARAVLRAKLTRDPAPNARALVVASAVRLPHLSSTEQAEARFTPAVRSAEPKALARRALAHLENASAVYW
jgi:tetratricopeptide repeat protein